MLSGEFLQGRFKITKECQQLQLRFKPLKMKNIPAQTGERQPPETLEFNCVAHRVNLCVGRNQLKIKFGALSESNEAAGRLHPYQGASGVAAIWREMGGVTELQCAVLGAEANGSSDSFLNLNRIQKSKTLTVQKI